MKNKITLNKHNYKLFADLFLNRVINDRMRLTTTGEEFLLFERGVMIYCNSKHYNININWEYYTVGEISYKRAKVYLYGVEKEPIYMFYVSEEGDYEWYGGDNEIIIVPPLLDSPDDVILEEIDDYYIKAVDKDGNSLGIATKETTNNFDVLYRVFGYPEVPIISSLDVDFYTSKNKESIHDIKTLEDIKKCIFAYWCGVAETY